MKGGLYKSYTANKQTEVYVKFAPVFNQLSEVKTLVLVL